MISCVMFDLDGTLCDTLRDLAEATNYALRQAGYPEHPLEKYKQMVGNGITKLIERALPQQSPDPEEIAGCRAAMLAYYQAHLLDYTRPYPGMEALIEALSRQGVGLYVVTNKPQAQAQAIVEALYPGRFAGVAGQRIDRPTKPDPWGVHLFLTQGGYRREQCLFVGDSNVDAQTAKAAGVRCAGVTWGFRSRQELLEAGAQWVVDRPEALLELVKSEA